MKFEPHPYQRYAISRIVNEKHVGLLLDMGLGKTIITLTAVAELMYERLEVAKVLIIAPKKVSEATWQIEGSKWAHTACLRFATVLGSEKKRVEALESDADIYVINRENIAWLCERYAGKRWPFDMIVFDESSSFKNSQSQRFKWIRRVLMNGKGDVRTVILTGTPAPNGLEDLWAQIYLLDMGERLGRNITAYRDRYFDYNMWTHQHSEKPGAFDAVQRRIADICVSMSAEDYLTLPEMVVEDVHVKLDEKSEKLYEKIKKEMVLEWESSDAERNGSSIDGACDKEVSVLSAAALTGKLLQLCGGSYYDPERKVIRVHDCKQDALCELLEALNGEKCLLFYAYQHELERVCEAAKNANCRRVRVLKDASDVADWNAGKIDLLIAHPASCAYGLNLQQGGNHIVWYTLTWNLELYQQANARLHRQGQTRPVFVHRLICDGKMDSGVSYALEGKEDCQKRLLEYLKAEVIA